MILFLSFACFASSVFITAGSLFLKWPFFAALPVFTSSAAALTGVLIAALEYRARKTKKKKRAPMALLILNAFSGIAACVVWLYWLMVS